MVLSVAHGFDGRSQPSPGRGLYGLPVRDCWSASDPGGGGKVCATTPGLEPVPGPWTGGSLASRPDRPVRHGQTGGGAQKRSRASGWAGRSVRIAGRPKCASTPRVVSAFQYGSKSGHRLPPNPTPASCTSSGACRHVPPATPGCQTCVQDENSACRLEERRKIQLSPRLVGQLKHIILKQVLRYRWRSSFNGSAERLPSRSAASGSRQSRRQSSTTDRAASR